MEHKDKRHMAGPQEQGVKHAKTQNTRAGNGNHANSDGHTETTKRNNEKPTRHMAKDDEDVEERSSKITGSKAGTVTKHPGR